MSQTSAVAWWQNSLQEMGVQGMERLLPRDAKWDAVLASGREDLAIGMELSQMQTGMDRTVVEIGCGLGRVSQALAQHFGRVIALDVAPALLQQARQNNSNPAIQFELIDGNRLLCPAGSAVDTVFSYEVLYILPPATFRQYVHDSLALLEPGGEFVFQMNLMPLRWTTRLSYAIRSVLWRCGVKEWRGWPTGPGFRRYAYTERSVCRTLVEAGFDVVRVNTEELQRAWFVARKPKSR